MLPFHPGAAVASYGSHTGPGRLFARGSHRAVGLTSLAAAGGNILSEWWIDYAEGSVPASQEARAE